ncbi:MAG TPA: hypothetical protein VNY73_09160, partial [Bacteroidia bacterium]|nr:hypothetical protein [Bacteroidia bacterium]
VYIPLAIGIINRKKVKNDFPFLLYLAIVSFVLETVIISLHTYHINNLVFLRASTIAQFVLLSLFYNKSLVPSKVVTFIRIFIVIFLAVALFDLYKNGLSAMDDMSLTFASIVLMLYSLFTFYHIMQNPVQLNILSDPLFWFNTAVLIYFSGCLFLFLFSSYILTYSPKARYELWGINSVLNIIFNSLTATGFWKTRHRQI